MLNAAICVSLGGLLDVASYPQQPVPRNIMDAPVPEIGVSPLKPVPASYPQQPVPTIPTIPTSDGSNPTSDGSSDDSKTGKDEVEALKAKIEEKETEQVEGKTKTDGENKENERREKEEKAAKENEALRVKIEELENKLKNEEEKGKGNLTIENFGNLSDEQKIEKIKHQLGKQQAEAYRGSYEFSNFRQHFNDWTNVQKPLCKEKDQKECSNPIHNCFYDDNDNVCKGKADAPCKPDSPCVKDLTCKYTEEDGVLVHSANASGFDFRGTCVCSEMETKDCPQEGDAATQFIQKLKETGCIYNKKKKECITYKEKRDFFACAKIIDKNTKNLKQKKPLHWALMKKGMEIICGDGETTVNQTIGQRCFPVYCTQYKFCQTKKKSPGDCKMTPGCLSLPKTYHLFTRNKENKINHDLCHPHDEQSRQDFSICAKKVNSRYQKKYKDINCIDFLYDLNGPRRKTKLATTCCPHNSMRKNGYQVKERNDECLSKEVLTGPSHCYVAGIPIGGKSLSKPSDMSHQLQTLRPECLVSWNDKDNTLGVLWKQSEQQNNNPATHHICEYKLPNPCEAFGSEMTCLELKTYTGIPHCTWTEDGKCEMNCDSFTPRGKDDCKKMSMNCRWNKNTCIANQERDEIQTKQCMGFRFGRESTCATLAANKNKCGYEKMTDGMNKCCRKTCASLQKSTIKSMNGDIKNKLVSEAISSMKGENFYESLYNYVETQTADQFLVTHEVEPLIDSLQQVMKSVRQVEESIQKVALHHSIYKISKERKDQVGTHMTKHEMHNVETALRGAYAEKLVAINGADLATSPALKILQHFSREFNKAGKIKTLFTDKKGILKMFSGKYESTYAK